MTGQIVMPHATPLAWASLAYQSVIVAFASYLAWFWLVTRYPAGRLSAFTFLTPLIGVAAAALLLGEGDAGVGGGAWVRGGGVMVGESAVGLG